MKGIPCYSPVCNCPHLLMLTCIWLSPTGGTTQEVQVSTVHQYRDALRRHYAHGGEVRVHKPVCCYLWEHATAHHWVPRWSGALQGQFPICAEKVLWHWKSLRLKNSQQWCKKSKSTEMTASVQGNKSKRTRGYTHICCFTSVCPFVCCCVEGKICRKCALCFVKSWLNSVYFNFLCVLIQQWCSCILFIYTGHGHSFDQQINQW